jgi:hypothetical protein
VRTHIGNLLHVVNHLIVALSLLTEPGEESFTGKRSVDGHGRGFENGGTFRAKVALKVSDGSYQWGRC